MAGLMILLVCGYGLAGLAGVYVAVNTGPWLGVLTLWLGGAVLTIVLAVTTHWVRRMPGAGPSGGAAPARGARSGPARAITIPRQGTGSARS